MTRPAPEEQARLDFIGRMEGIQAPWRGKGMNTEGTVKSSANNVFGPPLSNPAPPLRLRMHPGDEKLQQIWGHDEEDRKDIAFQNMALGPTLVDKMDEVRFSHPAYANHVEPNKPTRRRPSVNTLHDQALRDPERIPLGIQGFPGMGKASNPSHRQGLSTKPIEPFIPEGMRLRYPVTARQQPSNPITGERIGIYQSYLEKNPSAIGARIY